MGEATVRLAALVGSYYRRTPSGGLIRVKGYAKGLRPSQPTGKGVGPPRTKFMPDPATGDKSKDTEHGYLLPVPREVLETVRSAKVQSEKKPADPQVAAALLFAAGQHNIAELRESGVAEDVLEVLQSLIKSRKKKRGGK